MQVAEANGVSEQELTDHLLGELETKLAEAVESGRIDQAKADEILAGAAEKIAECINREGPPERPEGFGEFREGRFPGGFGRFPGGFHGDFQKDGSTDVTEAVVPHVLDRARSRQNVSNGEGRPAPHPGAGLPL